MLFVQLEKEALKNIITAQKKWWLSDGVRGKSYKNRIKVEYRPRFYRNSWNPIFYGIISEHPDGTMITGYFQMRLSVRIFMLVWRAFVILLFFLELFIVAFSDNASGLEIFLIFSLCIIMLIFPYILERIGKTMGEKNKAEILGFFEKPRDK